MNFNTGYVTVAERRTFCKFCCGLSTCCAPGKNYHLAQKYTLVEGGKRAREIAWNKFEELIIKE